METFSLLNYWKSNGSVSFLPQPSESSCRYPAGESTTIVASATETEDEEADEGPFFDLEFALPAEEDENEQGRRGEGDSDCTDGGCEYKFTLSSCSGGEDRDLDFSPSDDVFFKETIEEEEPPSSSSTGAEQTCSVKAPAAQLSASILKSATKLRVFMLGMKKSKLLQTKSEAIFGSGEFHNPNSSPLPLPPSHSPESQSQQKSTVTVNLKVEDVPIISLFTRENSSKNSSSSSSSSSLKKQNGNDSVVSDDKRFVMMQKYLKKKVKPLYIRVSRRYGEKLRHSGQLTIGSSAPSTRSKVEKVESMSSKHLGKSRSSSSTATLPSSKTATVMTTSESTRRDDSLLQQQDSIQNAILHCKTSFNSSRVG